MIEKLKYRGPRGRVEIIGDTLAVVFDINSIPACLSIRKALGSLIPTPMQFYWETASKLEMTVPNRGIFKNTFKYDGEYAIKLNKENLPEVLKAIGYKRPTEAQMANFALNRTKRHKTSEAIS